MVRENPAGVMVVGSMTMATVSVDSASGRPVMGWFNPHTFLASGYCTGTVTSMRAVEGTAKML